MIEKTSNLGIKQMTKPTKEQINWANCELEVIIHLDLQVFEPTNRHGGGGFPLDTFILDRETNPWKSKVHNASKDPYHHNYVTLNNHVYGELSHHLMHVEIDGNALHIQFIREN
jgi:hypothetical protein